MRPLLDGQQYRMKGVSLKLMAKWEDPGLITGMHGDVTTEVQMGAHKFTTVHMTC